MSALEELRAEREKLRTECVALESSIGKNIYYVRHNFGSLLASGAFNGLKNTFASFWGGNPSSQSVSNPNNNSTLSSLSTVWGFVRPFAIGWATKKITARLFK
jgi:hypothetical protein